MVSGAHSWEPLKSCPLSAFSPEPKDRPGLEQAPARSEQTAADPAWAQECAAPGLPARSPCVRGASCQPRNSISVFRCLPPLFRLLNDFYFFGFCLFQKIGKQPRWMSVQGGKREVCSALSTTVSHPNMAVLYVQQLLFFKKWYFQNQSLFFPPSDHFLPNKFTCNDWKFCTGKTLKYCWERVKVVKCVVLEKHPFVAVVMNGTPPASCDSVVGQTVQNRALS